MPAGRVQRIEQQGLRLPKGFRINLRADGTPSLRGFQMKEEAPPTSHPGVDWAALAGRKRSPPSVVTEYEQLSTMQSRYGDPMEVRLYEAKIAALTGMHREGWLPIDWNAIASSPPPQAPARPNAREQHAAHALSAYKPTLSEKIFGAEKRRAELSQAVEAARAHDEHEYRALHATYESHRKRWEWFNVLARSVLAGEVCGCQSAIEHLGPFSTFKSFGSSLNVAITRPWCIEAWVIGNTNRVIPTETIGYTPTGRISRKETPDPKYWAIYQDHVCSAALSVGREIFAILPVPIVMVHVGYPYVSSKTSHPDCSPMLSVAFERTKFLSLNLHGIDPSDSMANFEHRMDHKKKTGLEPIEPLTPDDLDVLEE
ncbi:MAG: hypothetical protein HOW73_10010 [Polyangiaceae bacterium]|nr:hypothetical protein [Polyangiaceae bacterium]